MTPEARARVEIDRLLEAFGRHVCDYKAANIHAATGVAIREFPLVVDHGHVDYLLYIEGKAAGVIKVQNQGATLTDLKRQVLNARATATALPFGIQ